MKFESRRVVLRKGGMIISNRQPLHLAENKEPFMRSNMIGLLFVVLVDIDRTLIQLNFRRTVIKYLIPNTTFFSLPLNGSLGTLITSNVSSIVYNKINPQPFNEIIITFYDQLFTPLILSFLLSVKLPFLIQISL